MKAPDMISEKKLENIYNKFRGQDVVVAEGGINWCWYLIFQIKKNWEGYYAEVKCHDRWHKFEDSIYPTSTEGITAIGYESKTPCRPIVTIRIMIDGEEAELPVNNPRGTFYHSWQKYTTLSEWDKKKWQKAVAK